MNKKYYIKDIEDIIKRMELSKDNERILKNEFEVRIVKHEGYNIGVRFIYEIDVAEIYISFALKENGEYIMYVESECRILKDSNPSYMWDYLDSYWEEIFVSDKKLKTQKTFYRDLPYIFPALIREIRGQEKQVNIQLNNESNRLFGKDYCCLTEDEIEEWDGITTYNMMVEEGWIEED